MRKKHVLAVGLAVVQLFGTSMFIYAQQLPADISSAAEQHEMTEMLSLQADTEIQNAGQTETPAAESPTTELTAEPSTELSQTEALQNQTDITEPDTGDDYSAEGDGSSTDLDDGTETDSSAAVTENEEAFDFLIIEDEDGIMQQENSGDTEASAVSDADPLADFSSNSKKKNEKASDVSVDFKVVSEKVTNWGENLYDFQSYPIGDLSQNEKLIYQYLRNDLGFNKAAAAGVLANICCESGFSTVAVGDGGSSYGLCQWHAGRFSALVSWCNANGYNYHLLDGQLAYLSYELQGGYRGVYEYLKQVPDSPKGAYEAGYYWCMNFEIPSDTVNRSISRGRMAMNQYYPADLDHMSDQMENYTRNLQILDELISEEKGGLQKTSQFCMYGRIVQVSRRDFYALP